MRTALITLFITIFAAFAVPASAQDWDLDIDLGNIEIGGRDVDLGKIGMRGGALSAIVVSTEGYIACDSFTVYVNGREKGVLNQESPVTLIRFSAYVGKGSIAVQLFCIDERSPLRRMLSDAERARLRSGDVEEVTFDRRDFPRLR